MKLPGSPSRQSSDSPLSEESTLDRQNRQILRHLKRLQEMDDTRVEFGRLDYPAEDIYLRLGSFLDVVRLNSCAKEPWTVDWIDAHVSVGDVVYDVGANVGAYSLIAAKRVGPTGNVVAIEPAFSTFAALCENIIANDVSANTCPLPVALSEATGLSLLRFDDRRSSASHTLSDIESKKSRPALYEQRIMSFRLDDLISALDLPFPNHVKLDVEGAEQRVLAGATRTLADERVRSLLMELHRDQAEPVRELLTGMGFRHEQVGEVREARAGEDYGYSLFVREGST